MRELYILTDYKGNFGSKQKTEWYKNGMDLDLIENLLLKNNFSPKLICFSEIDFATTNFKDKIIIYTSSEDPGYFYKDYIEDIIYGLNCQGAILLPDYKFLRANNNKVFMEILRDIEGLSEIKNIKSKHFGTVEKLIEKSDKLTFPLVLKSSAGAMSKGVYLARNKKQLKRKAVKIAHTPNWFHTLWEYKNYIKHKGKIKLTSRYRKKFIVQDYVEGLDSDWKVLIYNDKIFTLNRRNRKNDFRASGSGLFSFKKDPPEGMLDLAKKIYDSFKVPHLSLDIAFNGEEFFLIEFQALYFGTKTLESSPFYFQNIHNKWEIKYDKLVLEEVYIESLCNFIKLNH
jgi:glutathione synthase/RimK-type ligase-like ATP-grasp enzyme